MIWKHFEHLAQPGTAQCFPYCAAYETYIVLCRKLGWHVLPGILLSVSHLSTSVLGLHCSCYCVWLHVCSEDSESGPHAFAASTSTHCAISLAPNNCFGTKQLHMLWQVFHWSPLVQYQLILKGQAPLDGLHVLTISYSAVIIWINHV